MAEWSQMPEDLLGIIAQRLDTQFDLLRFRSVCSSWRSSVAPAPDPFRRGRLLIPPIYTNPGLTGEDHLSKDTIFLLGVPRSFNQTVPSSWLLKVREDVPRKMNLLNPLPRCELATLPEDFPKDLDLMSLRVLELGHEYVLRELLDLGYGGLYDVRETDKVVFVCLDDENEFVLLRIILSGVLAMFKSEEKRWFIVQDMQSSSYKDVIFFKGEFYAVDGTGRTVVVGLDLSVTLIAQSNSGGGKKFLVESVGELLLVYRYSCLDDENDDDGVLAALEEFLNEEFLDDIIRPTTVGFKVYKLDREEKVWNEVKDLGERVLFLGDASAFSASAADLGACKGNCIFFLDHWRQAGASSLGIGVYHMDSGSIGPIEDYAGYSELFWPPPDWIASRTNRTLGSK